MAIKRGVSFYSYQQAQFFGQMDWKAMIREVHDNLKTDGVEIINQSSIPHYPFPSQAFIYDWNNYLARYDMKAITMDVYLDTMRFRDHVMTHREAAEQLKMDIKLAADLGFQNIRCLAGVPLEVMIMAEETAVKYNVRIGKEIHSPVPIRPERAKEVGLIPFGPGDFTMVPELLEHVDKTGSKFIGLVPDFGIFQHHIPRITREHTIRISDPKKVAFCESHLDLGKEGLRQAYREAFGGTFDNLPDCYFPERPQSALPEHIREVIPYIFSMHGKFYEMTEIPGNPGHYEEVAIDYENAIAELVKGGFDGYINSEYEGQRDQQDRGEAYLPDEVKEVRRHHEMLARLSGEGENIVQNLY